MLNGGQKGYESHVTIGQRCAKIDKQNQIKKISLPLKPVLAEGV
jgi:hypothetical protein